MSAVTCSVTVHGVPKGQPRARSRAFVSRKTGKMTSTVYTPAQADVWRSSVAYAVQQVTKTFGPLYGPALVHLVFRLPRPKGHYRRDGRLKDGAPRVPCTKPDLDNLEKLVLDAMTSVGAWLDDALVADLASTKLYADAPSQVGADIRWGNL